MGDQTAALRKLAVPDERLRVPALVSTETKYGLPPGTYRRLRERVMGVASTKVIADMSGVPVEIVAQIQADWREGR